MVAWLCWLIAAMAAYIAQLAAIVLLEHRRQAHMTAWLFIAFVCPFIGFAAYLMLGRRLQRIEALYSKHDNEERLRHAAKHVMVLTSVIEMGNEEMRSQNKLFNVLNGLGPFPLTGNNRTKVLTDGESTFHAILGKLAESKHHIHLDYYTIRNDGIGGKFLNILAEQARKGVEVRVLYDGIGSLHLATSFMDTLRQAGAETCCFSPPRFAFFERRLNFRNHRKIVVIDGKVGFLGGINIGDEYLGLNKKLGFWRDTHLQIEGDAVYYLQELFLRDWQTASGKAIPNFEEYMPPHHVEEGERALIVPGKPGVNDQKIVEVLFSAMAAAKTRIYVTTPYFIPDPSLAASLRTAARSGIDVKLIIPGIGDSDLVLLATMSYIEDMLNAGVRVYRYQKGFIHAKVLIVDSMLASVGTANLDMRSLYSNYELLALLFGEKSIQRLERDFINDLEHSVQIDREQFAARSRKQKAAESIMHMLSPLL